MHKLCSPLLLLLNCSVSLFAQAGADTGWPEYGGTAAGQRYSAAAQVDEGNVSALRPIWSFHTGALHNPRTLLDKFARFEATPVLWNGTLFFDSPFNSVFAVDAETGKPKWSFDPKVDHSANIFMVTARGVALWHDAREPDRPCANRVLVATIDRRLIALDANTGAPCKDFGNNGTVDLAEGIYLPEAWLLEYTSPPIVVGNNVILGSSVGDNQTINSPSGEIRAFDARSGHQVWSWQPVRWESAVKDHQSGGGNAWAPLAADPANDLVFLPTGSAALDYYGGKRVGDNRDADSVVALRASTGEKVWAFQLVHHDVWDYDSASQPLLFTFRGHIPAIAVMNKTGMIYVFQRLTGEPLFPIEERPVPQTDVPGEATWPTQPFSTLPSLLPLRFSLADLTSRAANEDFCKGELPKLRNEGLFTPPSLGGSLIYPSAIGGPNWGSSAFDPRTGILYTRVSSAAYRLYLVPRENPSPSRTKSLVGSDPKAAADPSANSTPAREYRPPDMGLGASDGSIMRGVPYEMFLQPLIAPDNVPCAPSPYGRLVATDLNGGTQLWSVAHGSMTAGLPGSFGVGGAIVTAGNLVFVASASDPYLRAYSSTTGALLWEGKLPATANATPMTYEWKGRQYVVIAVGGHWHSENDESDTLQAFALPEDVTRKPAPAQK